VVTKVQDKEHQMTLLHQAEMMIVMEKVVLVEMATATAAEAAAVAVAEDIKNGRKNTNKMERCRF
jgi:hypothetical protein